MSAGRRKMGKPMTENIPQLFVFTGARNTGKTGLAATYALRDAGDDKDKINAALSGIAYFDAEKSANRIRQQFAENKLADFGHYVDLQEMFSALPTDEDLLDRLNKGEVPWVTKEQRNALIGYYQHILQAISDLPRNKYSVFVLDTAEKFESGMAAYVEANKTKFGITSTAYGKLWTEGVFPLYENLLQAIWGRGIETIILNFHLKNVWEGSRPVPGKVAMSGKKILYRLSSLMLWLVNDSRNTYGEPAALVLKERMGRMVFEGGRFRMRQMLPPRIPTCDWYHIGEYLRDGYNNANPSDLEVLSRSEQDMISPLLTDAQTALMLADAKLQQQENTMALGQMGLVQQGEKVEDLSSKWDGGSSETSVTNAVTNAENEVTNSVPKSRAEAMKAWLALGRPIPELLGKLAGVEDGDVEKVWEDMVRDE